MVRMRGLKKKLLFLAFFSLLSNVSAVPNKNTLLQRGIKEEKENLEVVSKKIRGVEVKLEKINNEILKLGSQKQELETAVFTLKKQLLESMAHLSTGKKNLKRLLTGIVANTLGNNDDPSELVARKVLLHPLKERLKEYNEAIKQTQKMQDRLAKASSDIQLFETKEKMLLDTIANLEETKRQEAEKYIQSKNSYQEKLREWQQIKRKVTKPKVANQLRERLGLFARPLDEHASLHFKKKGVTFLFENEQPVRASRDGKIIHKGELSTFGNVMMVDHGKDIISVYLGDFKPTMNKGKTVKEGDILGYTALNKTKKTNQLYFEVREKNKARPTIHLFEDELLASAKKN